jgi:hypothetical protein
MGRLNQTGRLGRPLRVLGVRDDDADPPPALVIEELPGSGTRAAS